jgi:hypothetical protein
MHSCSGSIWLSLGSVNTRNPKGVLACWESNDCPSHTFYTNFVKNSLGGIASASNEQAASPTKKEIELPFDLGLESE